MQAQNIKIQEQESSIADLKKHMDEWDQKFSDLTGELNRAREDIAAKSSIPSTPETSTSSSPPKFYKSNIKPRMAQLIPTCAIRYELDRKRKSNMNAEVPLKLSRFSNSPPMEEDLVDKRLFQEDDIARSIKEKLNEIEEKGKMRSLGKSDFTSFLSNSLESLLKTSPISSIRARKRKITEDIDLK